MEEDDPGLPRLGDAATGALVQLLLVSVVLAFFLSMTSGNPLLNLPLALLMVWAVRFLAQVRVTVRWDASTRRLNLILTRQRKEGNAGALLSRGKRSFRSDNPPADWSTVPSASEKGSQNDNDGPRMSKTIPFRRPSQRETELMELLRQVEKGDDGNAFPEDSPLLGAWGRLRDHILEEFVTTLWYRPITEDSDFVTSLSRLLDASFAELAHRARGVDLARLLLRRVPDILVSQLEAFRDAREACGGVDAYVRLTPADADKSLASELRKRGQLHTGVDWCGINDSAELIGTPQDPVSRVLSRHCDVVAAALLPPGHASNPILLALTRELLACSVLRPLLGFANPSWVHRGLACLVAPEDDVASPPSDAMDITSTSISEKMHPHRRSVSLDMTKSSASTFNSSHPLGSASSEEEGIEDDDDYELARMIADEDDTEDENIIRDHDHATMSASVGGADVSERFSKLTASVTEVNIVGKGTAAYAVYTICVKSCVSDGTDNIEELSVPCGEMEHEWVVARRFRNFEALHRRLVDAGWSSKSLPELPKKRYLLQSLEGSFVEARRRLLDNYLGALLGDDRFCDCRDISDFLDARKGAYDPTKKSAWKVGSMGASWGGDNRSRTLIRRNSVDETSCSSSTQEGREGVTETVSVLAQSFTQTMNKSAKDATSTVSRALGRETGDELKPRIAGRRKANPLYPLGTSTRPAHHRVASAGAIRGAMPGDRASVASGPRTTDEVTDATNGYDESNNPDGSLSSTQALMNGPLLSLFEAIFHLQAKGFLRRTIVTVARQTLEFFVGSAVEDFVSSRMRTLRSPSTVTKAIDFIDRVLWPDGSWYQRSAQVDKDCPLNEEGADLAAAVAAAERERDESVRLRVRDAILASGSRGPLPGLLGTRNYTRAALDVLAAARSDLMMRQVGLLVMEAALEALFPELVAVEEHAGDADPAA
uniref:PX domain-containing protein n=1 Tax=Micromonas pusilla TaxID=38833 RepID=A0A7S0NJZ5_MICPS|mmetsp:Transcript_2878/g.11789  ORF Transcript_2878/g.11789 Transcript_2878/m.11789 type:complete len:942 (+) Transcript_2878:95-2920(+)